MKSEIRSESWELLAKQKKASETRALGDLPRTKYSWKRRDSSAETFKTHVGGISLGWRREDVRQ
ncbi:hypothetical protein N7463_009412 [Penicillium fimorum]|uniref:Uncharacterized protein n=1 Tax=Penicillium fimorum TaxID=1882269 RepID=A0A9X0C4P3_9EURO|nr:hypothetical protein N7463_009412 [Penicillium fimorum]